MKVHRRAHMFKASRANLLPALAAVTKAVQRRNTIPILSHVKIETSQNQLTLTSTDLDLQITVKSACDTLQTMAIALPGHLLNDAIRKLPDGADISLTIDNASAQITSGRSRFLIQTLPVDDFPTMDATEVLVSFSLAANIFDDICNKIFFATSTDETRYYLNGIHLHQQDGQLVAVATDGHRLAKISVELEDDISTLPPVIIPRHFWQIAKSTVKDGTPVMVSLSTNKIVISQNDITIVSKLIDGTFPEYQRVIPQKQTDAFIINRAELIAALERVLTISSERARAIRFHFSDNQLTLSTTDLERGEAQDQIDLQEGSSTTNAEMGFNGQYALDILNACGGDKVLFYLHDQTAPGRVEPFEKDDTVFVIMPMRL